MKDSDIDGLVAFAKANSVDLVAVGPEAPLVAGVRLQKRLLLPVVVPLGACPNRENG